MSDKPPTKLELVNAISDDPFDLDKLRVNPDFLETTNVRKLLTTVPIKKPNQQDFIRVHPSPAYRGLFAFIELKDDREIYIADLSEVPDLQTECFVANLFLSINRSAVLFLWPVRVPTAERRSSDWHVSAATAAQQAMSHWIRIKPNMSLGAYEIFQAESAIPDPVWPELTFQEISRIAFKDRLIAGPDHPVIRRLRGG